MSKSSAAPLEKDAANSNGDENQTDAIIEELKALAKSMLDATNAARRRSGQTEGRRNFDALVNATASSAQYEYLAASGRKGEEESRHVDPVGELNVKSIKREENLIDVPVSLSPQFQKQTATGEREAASDGNNMHLDTSTGPLDANNNSSLVSPDDCNRSTASGERMRDIQRQSESREAEDDDNSIFDGVKTTILFPSTDRALYEDVVSSAWKPEKLLLRPDGKTVQPPTDEDEDDEEDNNTDGNSSDSQRDKNVKVFRIPSFPYGGGVSEAQARELSKKFQQSIRDGSSRQGGAHSIRPKYISHQDFIADSSLKEAPQSTGFNPKSPYEFVVEVDRNVIFDAVRARELRRAEFQRLVKEKRAPATMGTFNLRVIMDPLKTGFEDEKNFPIIRGSIIADRYQIIQLLGKATFSRAVRCYDLQQPIYYDSEADEEEQENETDEKKEADNDENNDNDEVQESGKKKKNRGPVGYVEVCLKIINNTKDFFDQSLDEIRLLTLINKYKNPDEAHVIRLIDAFYYKEHTMLVTELLSDNLYEFSKYNREEEDEFYFTLPRLKRIAKQICEALSYVHSLNLIHADLKPENILFVSHRRCIVKVIDFGSSCFLSDHLSSYIQSRSYRAPEVVFGCDYDGRIDVWSLGSILVELVTGDVLFTSETVPEMLARMTYVCGQPFPRSMLWEGRHTNVFINKFGCIYENGSNAAHGGREATEEDAGDEPYYIYTPVPPSPAVTSTSSNPRADVGAVDANKGEEVNNKSSHSNKEGGFVPPKIDEPYGVLWYKLEAAGMTDPDFFSFVKQCLTLDAKCRPTSKDLLSHPFIVDEPLQ